MAKEENEVESFKNDGGIHEAVRVQLSEVPHHLHSILFCTVQIALQAHSDGLHHLGGSGRGEFRGFLGVQGLHFCSNERGGYPQVQCTWSTMLMTSSSWYRARPAASEA